jgi:flagellar biosynthetic protein FlhB
MAGDKTSKTEKPTEKKKKDSRREGQVVRSQDLVPWLLVVAATFIMPSYLGTAGDVLTARFAQVRTVAADPTPQAASAQLSGALGDIFQLCLPILIGAGFIALVATLGQTGFMLSSKALKPQFKRLNPVAGLKRIASPRGQWEAVKAALRLAMVAMVAIPLVMGVADDLTGRPQFELGASLAYLGGKLIDLARLVGVLGLLIAALDYAMQRRNHLRELKMSKQEIKDEQKQSDGDPHIKGRMRQAARQMSRNRMLANAAPPTVIVVNPTHYSVALRYDEAIGVPVVVDKGVGVKALRIRADGLARSVPVVECRPLARALFRVCEVGTPVPNEMFQGVAVLLAFVHRLGSRRSLGGVHLMPFDIEALAIPEKTRKLVEARMAAEAKMAAEVPV